MMFFATSLAFLASHMGQVLAGPLFARADPAPANVTTCNGKKYVYKELAGYGKLASDARDKFGDTIGGFGSAIALDKASCGQTSKKGVFSGTMYGLPDRGWNTNGTQNTQTRIHKFTFTFEAVNATVTKPASPNFKLIYVDTILLTGPDGAPLTGLDPTTTITYPGFPKLPLAKYTGNGYGQDGPGGSRVALDTEGLVIGLDGTFWISDEYGPYLYQFDRKGKMIQAVRPPNAFVPIRNGTESFSAASPPIYNPNLKTVPEQPDTGRGNNQGLEALTRSPDGKYLFTLLQSSTLQDGGSSSTKRRNTRLLKYSLSGKTPSLLGEWAVQLPLVSTGKVASQSEMHYVSENQFLVLSRDSGAGHGQPSPTSLYRNVDVIDISAATNILGKYDNYTGQIASRDGELKSDVKPALYCSWLSYNNNDQLNRFNLHNGGAQDAGLLNEKWESFALLPIDDSKPKDGKDYFLITVSDNDFITQNGYINSGKFQYKDGSGYNLDSQVLIFKVTLPAGADPL